MLNRTRSGLALGAVVASILGACSSSSDHSGAGGSSSATSGDSATSSSSSASGGGASSSGSGGAATCDWRKGWAKETVKTPFTAPNDSLTFTPPDIPCAIFKITDHGAMSAADPDAGGASNTKAFADTVAAAVAAGGGVVFVPAGTWLTGAIHLDSKIELHLEAGATVLFSQNTKDYLPAVLTRWEGLDVMNFSPFVYALNAHDVAITGPGPGASKPGILDGQGSSWWSWKGTSAIEDQAVYDAYIALLKPDGTLPNNPLPAPPTSAKEGGLRPALVECNGCQNLLIDGIETANAPYWTLHPLYSTNVVIRNSNITSNPMGSNGDGIDVDSSKSVLIEDDTFATSDDIISLKSGLNEVGIAVGKPTEEVVIRNIKATLGHAISIGSEMSGGISNVYVTSDTSITLNDMQYLLRMKTLPGRGGVMQNIWFENVTGDSWTKQAIEITTNYPSSTIKPHNPSLLPYAKNVSIKNVSGTSALAPALDLVGLAQAPFEGITFDNVKLTGTLPNGCAAVTGVTLTNSTISGVMGNSITCP